MKSAVATAAAAAAVGAAAAVAVVCLRSLLRRRRNRRRLPPSVGEYPLVGSSFHLREPWYLDLYERFGHEPVVTVQYGLQRVFYFNQWEPFKEAMLDNAEALSGRMSESATVALLGDHGGISSTDGELWREYRRFTLKVLRDFGFGRRGGEELVAGEAEHMCRTIDDAEGAPVDVMALMSTTTSNIICQLVFGSRLASEDPKFVEILKVFQSFTQAEDSNKANCGFLTMTKILDRLPFLLPVLSHLPGTQRVIDDFKSLFAYCSVQCDRQAAELSSGDRAANYIQAHLLHQPSNPEIFNDTRLALAVIDLFLAGTDTTSHTLRWAILYSIANPDVAEKAFEEIAEGVGLERLPQMTDKVRLHYTQAVIEEVLRKSSLVPLGVFHRVTEDIRVAGYQLRRDDICSFNVFAIHHDRRLFPQPEQFRPERHLRDGKFVACEFLSSFGAGRRACLGESLARMELLLLFSTLLQRYTFGLDPDEKRSLWDLTESPEFSKGTAVRAPPPHKIVFVRR